MATIAIAAAITIVGCSGGGSHTSGPSELETVTPSSVSPAPFSATTVAPLPAAASPRGAVEAYLSAEVAGDYDTSFGLLDQAERNQVVTPAAWRATKTRAPHVTGFTVEPGGNPDTVVTLVILAPAVDPILGVVPARARITWTPVREDGGWRVQLLGSTFEPRYPSDGGAAPAVLAWATARQACSADAADDRLVYEPDLPEALCHLAGTFTAGAPAPLASLRDPAPVLATYGPDAATWARVVRLSGPATIDVVTAPLGDAWVVIGAVSS